MLRANGGQSQRGREGRQNQGAAQRVTAFGKAGDDGKNGEARHRGNGGDDADPERIEPDRPQPDRKERQMNAGQTEQGPIEETQAAPKAPRSLTRSDGDF